MNAHGRILAVTGALAALALLPATAGANTASLHHLRMYKAEQHVTIGEAETNTYTLKCDSPDYAVDGMWRVDQVAYNPQLDDFGPWDRFNGVDILQSEYTKFSSTSYGYTFKVSNNSEDDAQLKLFVTCLGATTESAGSPAHTHTISPPVAGTATASNTGTDYQDSTNKGRWYSESSACPTGIAVAPGFRIDNGSAKIYRSYPKEAGEPPIGDPAGPDPVLDLTRWTWGFYSHVNTGLDIKTSIHCLDLTTGSSQSHVHKLKPKFRHNDRWDGSNQNLPHDSTTSLRVNCGEQEKGLVGGFDVDPSLAFDVPAGGPYSFWYPHWFLGMDPQIKSRNFYVQNTRPVLDSWIKLGVLCFNDRVGKQT
jgi:hypothetical protein